MEDPPDARESFRLVSAALLTFHLTPGLDRANQRAAFKAFRQPGLLTHTPSG